MSRRWLWWEHGMRPVRPAMCHTGIRNRSRQPAVTNSARVPPTGIRRHEDMTQTTEPDIIHEALAIIEKGLTEMQQRKLVSTDEAADLLLDVRTLLSTDSEAEEVSPN